MIDAVVGDLRPFVSEAVAIFRTRIARTTGFAAHGDAIERFDLSAFWLFRLEEGLFGSLRAAVDLRPDVHARTPSRGCAFFNVRMVTESCTAFSEWGVGDAD